MTADISLEDLFIATMRAIHETDTLTLRDLGVSLLAASAQVEEPERTLFLRLALALEHYVEKR